MMTMTSIYNAIVAAAIAIWLGLSPAQAQGNDLDRLFDSLRDPGTTDWQRIEEEIERRLSNSGSPSADLLLRRGMQALEAEDYGAAIDHLTALTDHAPEFSEGWNARASAYFMAGLYGPAMQDLARVLTLEPRHFGALSGLGLIYEQIESADGAIKAFTAALEINPHMPWIVERLEALEEEQEGEPL